LSVVHRPGQGHLTAFALEAAAASLNYFTDYYDIAYPGDKIDLIAIPDFAFGAMENLGCITFREVLLLVDPEHATQPELQNVADVVAHELAHMWFGDLVTMAWWEGIWLNEAFATFMEMKATDSFKPEWNRWTNFGLSRTAAFDIDSLQATRAIEFPVESPAEAEAMFDVLTYEKGAAVVRMLEQFLGEETFREGIRAYLASHSYSNTETSDLWGALESTSGEAVREIMKTWIYQGGYPVVSIDDQGKLWQRRFSYGEQTDDSIWAVPIRLRDKAGAQHRVLLTDHSANSPLPTAEVVVLNHEGAGFYRSQLSAEQLDRIGHEGPGDLSAVERFGLLDDTWALVIAGRIELDQYFNLLAGFGEETDISVWQRIAGSLTTIDHLLDGDRRPAFAAFVSQLLRPAFDRLGKVSNRSETDEQLRLRGVLLGALGTVGQDHELRQFSRELHSSGAVDPALLAAAVNVIAATGDTAEFNDFLERFSEPDSPQDMQRYLYALADFPSVEHGIHMAELTLSERVRSQNGPYVLQRLLQNREVGVDVWQFVTTNWDEIIEKFPGNSISRMLAGVTALSTPELEVQVRSFLAAHEVPQGATKIQQHLERLATNTRFRARLADSTIPGDH
ncbi:MAG: M1 family aminopeptidase, partial [Acidimicrobiales bacterium]